MVNDAEQYREEDERARERVYCRQGVQHSSLKRKPILNNGESLLGYKILVDGYNNDFQDFYSTAEYSKEKIRQACVSIDERERIKLKATENYMKTYVFKFENFLEFYFLSVLMNIHHYKQEYL